MSRFLPHLRVPFSPKTNGAHGRKFSKREGLLVCVFFFFKNITLSCGERAGMIGKIKSSNRNNTDGTFRCSSITSCYGLDVAVPQIHTEIILTVLTREALKRGPGWSDSTLLSAVAAVRGRHAIFLSCLFPLPSWPNAGISSHCYHGTMQEEDPHQGNSLQCWAPQLPELRAKILAPCKSASLWQSSITAPTGHVWKQEMKFSHRHTADSPSSVWSLHDRLTFIMS